jgi:NDP-sugar pyrophosphorylase family protein
MRALTERLPKPMLPVAGRPLLQWILEGLREAGIERIVIVTGYRAERIEEHFGDGSSLGLAVCYRRQVVQDGTARALLFGRDAIGPRGFLLAWGDILVAPRNYRRLLECFRESRCDGVLAVNWVEDPSRGAAVYTDEGSRIVRIVEKPPPGTSTTHWNNAGIGVFRPALFDYAATVGASPRGEYELPDAISAMIAHGRDIRALPIEGFWSDVGTPEDLERAEAFLSREIARSARTGGPEGRGGSP